jgi:hypothetical protein
MIRLFFILYCFEAGLLLFFAPWFREWDQIMMQIVPSQGLRSFLLQAWVRGAITGFGVVHLVWGAHDLLAVLTRRSSETSAETSAETAVAHKDQDRQAHDVPIAGDQ